jgi:hypothetical protein
LTTAITENPHFARIPRAAYEIGHLLKKLPTNFSAYEPLDPDTRLMAEAAKQHASNANDTLMHGIEALGSVVSIAGGNQDGEISQTSLMRLGELIAHLSVEAQFMQELDWSIGDVLAADDLRANGKKPLKAVPKGGAA